MKNIYYCLFCCILFGTNKATAQNIGNIGKNLGKKIETKVESGVNRGIDRKIDNAGKSVETTLDNKASAKGEVNESASNEAYDFKHFENKSKISADNFNARLEEIANHFSIKPEIVTLTDKKGKWLKMQPNTAYVIKSIQGLTDNYAIEVELCPQINFESKNEIQLGFLLIDAYNLEALDFDPKFIGSDFTNLSAYTSIVLNKPVGDSYTNPNKPQETYIIAESKFENGFIEELKNIQLNPSQKGINNKHTFAFVRTGDIVKVYFGGKNITSFTESSTEPSNLVMFIMDESSKSNLYVHSITVSRGE